MGFPDDYTNLPSAKKTNRYQAIGNSWAVPVIKWIGNRLVNYNGDNLKIEAEDLIFQKRVKKFLGKGVFFNFGKDIIQLSNDKSINCTTVPNKDNCIFADIKDIITSNASEDIYISPVGCAGILRRKQERNLKINAQLERILLNISSQMCPKEIEKRSLVQKRGEFSQK